MNYSYFEAQVKPSRASKIDFKTADYEQFKEALNETKWKKIIMGSEPDMVGAPYEEAICQVALKANATGHANMAKKRKQKRDDKIEKINKERMKLFRQNEHNDVTKQVKAHNTMKLETLTQQLKYALVEERGNEEKAAIYEIKGNSSAFFRYANKYRKTRDRICPLKLGDSYELGPKKIAEQGGWPLSFSFKSQHK